MKSENVGKWTLYDEVVHPARLTDEFAQGGNINSFCAKNHLRPATVYSWLRTHKAMKSAYDIGLCAAKTFYENLIQENLTNKDFNHYGADRQYTRKYCMKLVNIDDYNDQDTWTDKCRLVTDLASTGQLDLDHAKQILGLYDVAINAEQIDTLRGELEQLREIVAQIASERA